jgi:TPR repeat protein
VESKSDREENLLEKMDHAVEWNDKGCDFLDQKNINGAIPCFLKAIEIMPVYARAHCNLANCYDDIGQTEKAIATYEMAIKSAQAFDDKEDLEGVYREYAKLHQRCGNKAKELECIAAANKLRALNTQNSHDPRDSTDKAEKAGRIRLLMAEQGDVESQWILASMYASGEGVPRNVDESLKWVRLAAANGHPIAKEALEKLSRPK